jgi:diguanylate cyclase (GGDEF)-like protein
MAALTGKSDASTRRIGDGTTDVLAQLDPTSFNPYGQMLRMLLPRALSIVIYDHKAQTLWSADGCESVDLQQLVEDEIVARQTQAPAHEWCEARRLDMDQDAAYLFGLHDQQSRLMGVVVVVQGDRTAARSVENLLGLLRPALEVLLRELINQSSIDSLQRDLRLRDGDLAMLFQDERDVPEHLQEVDDFGRLIRICNRHLECGLGALLVPDKNIAVYRIAERVSAQTASELLSKTHRHLFALAQVQRRSMVLNRSMEVGPLAQLGHKVLACPVIFGGHRVVGVLAFFRPINESDFVLREIHLVELLARRVTQILLQSYDTSTGLLTRQALDQRVTQVMRSPQASPEHHVIYIDIDRLHVLNDNFGMHVGDEVLQKVADLIRGVTSHKLLATRISGDRFAVFMQNADLDAATHMARNLCVALDQLGYRINNKLIEITASFGVAPVSSCEHPFSRALASAEAACKAAKDRGRGRVEVFADGDQSIIRRFEDVSMLGAIREALDQDRFRMMAQPIVNLQHSGGVQHYELLLRMLDGNGDLMTPEKFLIAAERYQLAPAIDRWVVSYVLEVVSAVMPRMVGTHVNFAVNLSGQSLGDDEFLSFIEGKLAEYPGVAPHVSFELTETAAVSNIVRAERLMKRLRELGHAIALDDFGKGLSSLSYLKNLPVDCVKLDGELIRDLAVNERSRAMVTAVVQLAKAMKLSATAECIENETLHRIVRELGVDYAQGFGIGRPRPLEDVLHELVKTSASGLQRILKLDNK